VEVPNWWWPVAAIGAGTPIVTVLGIVGSHIFNSPSPEITIENRFRAWLLADELEHRNFRTSITEHPEIKSMVIDFHDPRLDEKLVELGSYVDSEKMRRYLLHIGRGSISFKDNVMEGDVPLFILRPKEVRGWWREKLETPPKVIISEIHAHTWDNVPTVHLHVKGEDLMPEDLVKLAEFISNVRDASRLFATTKVL